MSCKRYNWVPLHRTWNIRVYCNPSARKDCDETAPYNTPNCTAMREVGTTVSRQRVVVDGRDGAGVDICALNQVVDEKEEQHSEREGQKWICYCDTFIRKSVEMFVLLSTGMADKKTDLSPGATDK